MFLKLISVIWSLTLLQRVTSQNGKFVPFGEGTNDLTFSKTTEKFRVHDSGRHRSILWTLPKSFPAFGMERTHIRVSS